MKVLIFGAGNLLLSDEGFGVHFIRFLEQHYELPSEVELYDAGTLGIMATHKLEEAERVYIVDVIFADGEPGQCLRYRKEELMLDHIPVKLSPHQVGVQEMLQVSEMRGCCPQDIELWGVIPASFEPGSELTPPLRQRLPILAGELVSDLARTGVFLRPRR
jgi:hydrogenase maturation protease